MPFGQIEQSWFEEDLWSLHALPTPSQHCQVTEQHQQDHLVERNSSVVQPDENAAGPLLPADRSRSPILQSHRF